MIAVLLIGVLICCGFAEAAYADGVALAAGSENGSSKQAAPTRLTISSKKKAKRITITKAKLKRIKPQSFTGKRIKPGLKLYYKGKKLRKGIDYKVAYKRNVRPGTAHIVVKGKGAFKGKGVIQFRIKSNYVTIGDSYSTGSTSWFSPWPDQFAKTMRLDGRHFRHYGMSGSGFCNPTTFADLIWYATPSAAVSDVLIIGGTGNDLAWGWGDAAWGYRNTIKLIRKKWPNARIMHASPNWNLADSWYRATMEQRLPWYRSLAKECGVIYLRSCEHVLRGRWNYMQSDGNHPNQEGTNAIVRAACNDICNLDRGTK